MNYLDLQNLVASNAELRAMDDEVQRLAPGSKAPSFARDHSVESILEQMQKLQVARALNIRLLKRALTIHRKETKSCRTRTP